MNRALRDHLRRLGKKGGRAAAGAGGKARWAEIPPDQRSAIMKRVRAGKRSKQK
jgi:hypothetical protein